MATSLPPLSPPKHLEEDEQNPGETSSEKIQALFPDLQNFEAQDTDIVVATSPKSGTTWLKALAFCILNRKLYPDTQQHPLHTSNPHSLVPFLEVKVRTEKEELIDLTSLVPPRLLSTHLPFEWLPKLMQISACKFVYLFRDPKDMCVSFWHYMNKNQGNTPLEEFVDMFCKGQVLPYGTSWDHVLGYWKESLKNPGRILFLKYEEMKKEPANHVRRLAEFLGCPFTLEEETEGQVDKILKFCSLDSMRNLEVNKTGSISCHVIISQNHTLFRRGEIGDWKNYLTAEMVDRLDKISQEKFYGSGFEF
nr:SOT6 [Ilex asprella]